MVMFTTVELRKIMDKRKNIRNISVIGHINHGKSMLADCLVQASEIITQEAVDITMTDDRTDEAECVISTKAIGISLLYQMSNESLESYKGERDGNEYLINLVDSPGHVDFSAEVTAALRIADGAMVVIDCIEGICLQTENVLRQALGEIVRPVLCINKIDKIFPELQGEDVKLKFNGEQAYEILNNIIKNANGIVEAYGCTCLGDVQFYPEKGNVVFSAGLHGWAFTLAGFAKMMAPKVGMDESDMVQKLWGDNFYDRTTKIWTSEKTSSKSCVRGFVQFCYAPMKKLIKVCINNQKVQLCRMLENIQVSLRDDQDKLMGEALVKCVLQTWLPASTALLGMIIFNLPSPLESQNYRVENLYAGPHNDIYATAIRNCDPQGPLMLYVSKMIPASHGKFFAFGRVFSGKIATGMNVRIMGPSYEHGIEKDLYMTHVQSTVIQMGKNQYGMDEIPCGNNVSLIGLDGYITRSATLTNEKEVDACPMRAMKFSASPVMFVTIECKMSSHIPKLVEGLKRLVKSDHVVLCSPVDHGRCTVAGVGELHLEICLKDLQECFMDGTKVTVSGPIVSYRETVTDKSCDPVERKSPNTHSTICMVARPLHEKVVDAIDDGCLGPNTDPTARYDFLSKFGWDEDLANKIWCFGPESVGPNMLVGTCKKIPNLELVKKSIVAGFELASKEGVLAKEQMRGICFQVHNIAIHGAESSRGKTVELNQMVKTAIYESQLAAKPRLLEPYYVVAIQCPESALSAVFGILKKKGGLVFDEFERAITQIFHLMAYLPVHDSFGLAEEIRAATSGQVVPQCVFGYWDAMASDPLQASSPAGQMVLNIRERKMLERPTFQR